MVAGVGPLEAEVMAVVAVICGVAVVRREAEASLRTPRLVPFAVPLP